MELGRFALSLQALASILVTEMREIIERHIRDRESRENEVGEETFEVEEEAFMQLGGGRGDRDDQGEQDRGPWRPRKRSRTSRRRALSRRRRNLDMDVAEWQARAGPRHDHAISQTTQIARQLRSALSQPVVDRDRTGMCRSESDNMLQAMNHVGGCLGNGGLHTLRPAQHSQHTRTQ